jgi:hypothetical protein
LLLLLPHADFGMLPLLSRSGESASVWFSFVPPVSGRVRLTTAGSTGSSATLATYRTLLAMYRTSNALIAPSFNNTALVTKDTTGCGTSTGTASYACISLPQTVTARVKYYFQVDGQFGTKGSVVLTLSYSA